MLRHAVLLQAVSVRADGCQTLVLQRVPPVACADLAGGALCRAALDGVESAADVPQSVPGRHVSEAGRVVGRPLVLSPLRRIVVPVGSGDRSRSRSWSWSQVAYLEDPVLPQHTDF